jgi:acyl-CoA reductase-like NAD-dependent aldehyde dehydrogenase
MTYRMLIDGVLTDGAASLEVVNPATGEVLANAPRADAAQLDAAVAAAKRAFPAWAALQTGERRAKLEALADAVEARADEFARLLTQEQGKPLPQAQGEIGAAVAGLRAFAAMDVPMETLRETSAERIVRQRTPLAVELSGDAARDEGGAGPDRGEFGCRQARTDHAADDAPFRRGGERHSSRRRAQHHRRCQ